MKTEDSAGRPPSRRLILKRAAAGALALGLNTKGLVFGRNMLVDPTPGVTEGPYWVEEMLNRSDLRIDPATGIVQPGFPLSLSIRTLQIVKNRTVALPNAVVDLWHANAFGVYSDEAVEDTLGEKFLRGLQVSNARGQVNFTTVYPGWYSGRTPHIHLRLRLADATTGAVTYNFVTQMFFNEQVTNHVYSTVSPYKARNSRDTKNATDSIYSGPSEDNEVTADAGAHLMLKLSTNKSRVVGSFTVVINTADAGYNNATGGAAAGPGGAPPGGGTPPAGPPP